MGSTFQMHVFKVISKRSTCKSAQFFLGHANTYKIKLLILSKYISDYIRKLITGSSQTSQVIVVKPGFAQAEPERLNIHNYLWFTFSFSFLQKRILTFIKKKSTDTHLLSYQRRSKPPSPKETHHTRVHYNGSTFQNLLTMCNTVSFSKNVCYPIFSEMLQQSKNICYHCYST